MSFPVFLVFLVNSSLMAFQKLVYEEKVPKIRYRNRSRRDGSVAKSLKYNHENWSNRLGILQIPVTPALRDPTPLSDLHMNLNVCRLTYIYAYIQTQINISLFLIKIW